MVFNINGWKVVAFMDTGVYCCCMSEESYKVALHPLKCLCNVNVQSASGTGTDLGPLWVPQCIFISGTTSYTHSFIVC